MQRHTLFIKQVTVDDIKDRESTRQLLEFVNNNVRILQNMQIKLTIITIPTNNLKDPKIIGMLQKQKVTRLPSLVTSNKVYVGFKDIYNIYDSSIKNFLSPPDDEKNGYIKWQKNAEREISDMNDDEYDMDDDSVDKKSLMKKLSVAMEHRRHTNRAPHATSRPGGNFKKETEQTNQSSSAPEISSYLSLASSQSSQSYRTPNLLDNNSDDDNNDDNDDNSDNGNRDNNRHNLAKRQNMFDNPPITSSIRPARQLSHQPIHDISKNKYHSTLENNNSYTGDDNDDEYDTNSNDFEENKLREKLGM